MLEAAASLLTLRQLTPLRSSQSVWALHGHPQRPARSDYQSYSEIECPQEEDDPACPPAAPPAHVAPAVVPAGALVELAAVVPAPFGQRELAYMRLLAAGLLTRPPPCKQ